MYTIDAVVWGGIKFQTLWQKLWWKYMPTVEIEVKWPHGKITVDETHPSWDWTMSAKYQTFDTADPNDWYRPWLEENIGRQGWNWDWNITKNNSAENKLTIKVLKKHAKLASYMVLQWS